MEFSQGQKLAVLGANGSGKSTFLQVISGFMIPNEGTVSYEFNHKTIQQDLVYKEIAFVSPYLELIEDFKLGEIIDFHFKMKNVLGGLSRNVILDETGLKSKLDKEFRYFSSGMKQRIKLSLALMSDVKVLLFDEPCSNLDNEGVTWYNKMIEKYSTDRIIVVASNHNKEEFAFCDSAIEISSFR
jgi:ABC-type multidrug transport system ATPase subunit